MKTTFAAIPMALVLLLAACTGTNQPADSPSPQSQLTETTPSEGPYNVDAEEIAQQGEVCLPESELTDEFDPSERNIDLVMRAAELQPDDLPIRPTFDNILSNWADRRDLAELDSEPLSRLEELRNLGLLIDWLAEATLDVRNDIFNRFTRDEIFGLTLTAGAYAPEKAIRLRTSLFVTW